MQTKKEKAMALFTEGYNCAQSIVGAFAEEIGLDFETAVRLASPFGAGMGKLREVCGAVSGMFMVLGLLEGYSAPAEDAAKAVLYEKVQRLAGQFRDAHGTLLCRELLQNLSVSGGHVPEERTSAYYKVRPCARFVGAAAEILETHLKKQ